MSYDLIDREDGLALSRMANHYGIGVLVAVLAAEADGQGDPGTAKALRAAGITFCGCEAEEPEIDDSVKFCPECERPNQFGEVCDSCERAEQHGRYIDAGPGAWDGEG